MAITLSAEKIKLICNWVRKVPPHVAHFKLEGHKDNLLFVYSSSIDKHKQGQDASSGNVYVIDLAEKPLGEGGFGKVYAAYKINENASPTEPLIDEKESPDFVAKIQDIYKTDVTPEEVAEEMIFQNNYYPTSFPIDDKKKNPLPAIFGLCNDDEHLLISIMPYFKGKDLWHLMSAKNFFEKLTLPQRINLLAEIAMAFNVIHHDTPNTGRAVFVADIKPENILVDIEEEKKNLENDGTDVSKKKNSKNKRTHVYPIDFGLSIAESSEMDDAGMLNLKYPIGTPTYMAPEILKKKGGIKSDLYALTSIVIRLLGGTHPDKDKDEQYQINSRNVTAIANIPYNTTGLCNEFEKFILGDLKQEQEGYDLKKQQCASLKEAIFAFVARMQDKEYKERPGPKEFLRFCITLNNYFKTLVLLKSNNVEGLIKVGETKNKKGEQPSTVKKEPAPTYEEDLEAYVSTLAGLAKGKLDTPVTSHKPDPLQIDVDKTEKNIPDEEIKEGKQEIVDFLPNTDKEDIAPIHTATINSPQNDQQYENQVHAVTQVKPKTITNDMPNEKSQTVSTDKKVKLLNQLRVYSNSERYSTNDLTHAKAMLAKAFITIIEDKKIKLTIEDIKKYTKCLELLNYALEEIADNKKEAKLYFNSMDGIKNEGLLYQMALKKLFKMPNDIKQVHFIIMDNDKNINNTLSKLLSKVSTIHYLKANNPNVHVGKKYWPFFSSRLGRAASKLEKDLKKMEENAKKIPKA